MKASEVARRSKWAAALDPRCHDDWDAKCDLNELVTAAIATADEELAEAHKWARVCEANNTAAQALLENIAAECCGLPRDDDGRCAHRPHHPMGAARGGLCDEPGCGERALPDGYYCAEHDETNR